MKNILLLFMALFCFQNITWTQENTPKFRLELSNQSILTQGGRLVIAAKINFRIKEKTYNYASHFSGFWRLGNQLELGIGLGYANRDAYIYGSCPRGLLCNGPGPSSAGVYTRIRSLEIPLELRWKYLKSAKKIIPYFSFGIANRIPILNRSLYGIDKVRWSPKDYAMGAILGAGVQVEFFEKWSLVFAAQVRKDSNFKFEKFFYGPRWINEAVVKIGIGRNF